MKAATTRFLSVATVFAGFLLIASSASAQRHGRTDHGTLHSRSVTIEVGHHPQSRRAPTHVRATPPHVSGPDRGYLRDQIRQAEYDLRHTRSSVSGSATDEVTGYLRSASRYLEQADRLYLRSPYRNAREIEANVERAQRYLSRAQREARRYEREVRELARTATIELQRLTDDNDFYRPRGLRVELRHIRVELREARELLTLGEARRAHRVLDSVMRDIRNAERDMHEYGYFSAR